MFKGGFMHHMGFQVKMDEKTNNFLKDTEKKM